MSIKHKGIHLKASENHQCISAWQTCNNDKSNDKEAATEGGLMSNALNALRRQATSNTVRNASQTHGLVMQRKHMAYLCLKQ